MYTQSATGGNAASGFRATDVKSFEQQVFWNVDLMHAVTTDGERQPKLQEKEQATT